MQHTIIGAFLFCKFVTMVKITDIRVHFLTGGYQTKGVFLNLTQRQRPIFSILSI